MIDFLLKIAEQEIGRILRQLAPEEPMDKGDQAILKLMLDVVKLTGFEGTELEKPEMTKEILEKLSKHRDQAE